MGLNSSKTDVILKRRQEVSRYRLRGWTQREIAVQLCVSVGTINHDVAALEAEWRERALVDRMEHKTRVLAELTEVKRAAWGEKNYHAILQAIKAEVDLLGLNEPLKIEGTVDVSVSDANAALEQSLARFYGRGQGESVAEHLN